MLEYKLIVAGGRDFADANELAMRITQLSESQLVDGPVALVSGMARGADKLAWEFARTNNIRCYEFPADWDSFGRSAGYIRNKEMADFADGLLAFWDGQSRGTKHMIDSMMERGKFVHVIYY